MVNSIGYFGVGLQWLTYLIFSGLGLDGETNVVLWYVLDCTESSGSNRDCLSGGEERQARSTSIDSSLTRSQPKGLSRLRIIKCT